MTRAPGTRAGIDRDGIVAAALELLRTEGLDAVSMRRIAARLGVAPNALYGHIGLKSELIELLLDAVLSEVPDPQPGPWRDRLVEVLSASRAALLSHPELVPLYLSRQLVGSNALRLGEAVLAALHEAGVEGEAAVHGLQVLLIHTIGSAAFEVPRRDDPDPRARYERGIERSAGIGGYTGRLSEPMARFEGHTVFRLGLDWLLDGLAPPAGR